jgi:hypothetical protein
MPDEQQTVHDSPAYDSAGQAPETLAYEPIEDEQDQWAEEPDELELPARPRRRLLTPIPLALLGVLLIAAGFIAGVYVEKGETSSSSSTNNTAAGLASRFAALRGGTSTSGTPSSKTSAGAATGGFPGVGTGASRPTSGTVAYLAGNTLYVTNSEGNTVKVNTSAATSVTKTVKTKVKGIYPGEAVTVIGATGSNGTVSAESISVGSSGSGLAALLGGSGASSSSSGSKSSGSGSAALFGSG